MYVSGETLNDVLEQLKQANTQITDLSKKVEELEKTKNSDDKVVSEALDKTLDRVEKIEEVLSKTRTSKQD
jgi:predicted transcriptional regulator